MNQVVVVSGAFTNTDSDWACFRETAEKFGITLAMIGPGREKHRPPDEELLRETADLITNRPEPYVVLSDSFDVFFARWDESQIARYIEEALGNLIVGAEDWCWPDGDWCNVYREHSTPWYAVNGGGCCGTRWAIVNLLQQELVWLPYSATHTNQEVLHRLHQFKYPMQIDTQCRIFQTFHGDHAGLIQMFNGEACNTVTGQRPMILHWNGSCAGMRAWYEQLNEGRWPRTRGLKPD